MIKVGNKKVILSTTLLVPDGEYAEFIYEIAPEDLLHCKFFFVQDGPDVTDKKTYVSSSYEDEIFVITFKNFNSSMGQSFNTPLNFALSNKREPIELLASVYKFGQITKIEMQITLEELI